ncbi:hypothetical protein CI610_02550 [invertebrate metagenome]|uniref:EamA domain-containing protein n=1 Tax=invertebrate metagenome TaxID=1711999 RepID=A0A2H9T5N4_9ZZZZ
MTLNLMTLVGYLVAVFTLGEEMVASKTIIISLIVMALYVFNKYETKQEESVTKGISLNVQEI